MKLFVSIFGPDGAGKSTQVRILANYFAAKGFKVKIVWIKSYHTLAYVLCKIFEKLSPYSIVRNSYGIVIRISPIANNKFSRIIWAWIEFISLLPWIVIRVYLPLLMGINVLADRYLIDSIVSISYSLNDPRFAFSFLARLMLRLIPKNSILIYLDSEYEEIRKRRGEMADTEEYILFQKSIYNVLSRVLGALRIDTSKRGIMETAENIRDYLESRTETSRPKYKLALITEEFH